MPVKYLSQGNHMKRKLQFMLPNIKAAAAARNKMLLASIHNENICFLAKPGIELGELHEANVFDKSDSINQGIRGIYTGAGLGLLAGIVALAFPPWYVHTHWLVILAITTLIGAVLWSFLMAVIGGNMFNSDLNRFKSRIEKGEIMMFVTVPFYKVNEVRKNLAGAEQV